MGNQFVRGRKKIAIWICLGAFLFSVICPMFQLVQAKTTESSGPVETLACTYTPHHHGDSCFENGEQICGMVGADRIVHQHDDKCYDANGDLVCELEETALHTHGDDCYTEETTLICTQEETDEHTHSEDCYETTRTLTCELEEVALHTHTADCYDETGALTCDLPEVIAHQHDDDCFTTTETVHVSSEKVAADEELEELETVTVDASQTAVKAANAVTTANNTATTYPTEVTTSLVSNELVYTDANGNLYVAYSINNPSAKAYPTGQSYASTTTDNSTYRSLATNANRFYNSKYDWPAILWCLWLGFPYNQNLTIDSTSTSYTGYNFLKRAKEVYGFSDNEAEAALRVATQLAIRHYADYSWSGIQGTYNNKDNSGKKPTTVDQKLLCLAGEIVQYAYDYCGTTPSGIEATLYKPTSGNTANLVVTKLERCLTIKNTALNSNGTNTMYADVTITSGSSTREESVAIPENGSVSISRLPIGYNYSYTVSLERDKNLLAISSLYDVSDTRKAAAAQTGSYRLSYSFSESNVTATSQVIGFKTGKVDTTNTYENAYIGYSSTLAGQEEGYSGTTLRYDSNDVVSALYVMPYTSYMKYVTSSSATTEELQALYRAQNDEAEVAYCFNNSYGAPAAMNGAKFGRLHMDETSGLTSGNQACSENYGYFTVYEKLEDADGDTFSNMAINNKLTGEDLRKKILSIALNGYPNDYSGYQEYFGLTDNEFRAVTQMAIWYYTDQHYAFRSNSNAIKAYQQLLAETGKIGLADPDITDSNGAYMVFAETSSYDPTLNKVTDDILDDQEYTSFINLYESVGVQQRGEYPTGTTYDYDIDEGEIRNYSSGTGDFTDKTYFQSLLNVGSVKAAKERNGSQLTLQKLVSGTGGSTSDAFTFNINLLDESNNAVTGTYYVDSGVVDGTNTTTAPSYTTLTFDASGNASVELKHGQQITIYGLPENYHFTIRETNAGSYTPSFSYKADTDDTSSSKKSVIKKSSLQSDSTNNPSVYTATNGGSSAITVTCTNTKETTVPTGVDGVIIWPYALIGGLSLMGLGYLLLPKRRRV
jgi:TQXA domain-containing protein